MVVELRSVSGRGQLLQHLDICRPYVRIFVIYQLSKYCNTYC